LSGFARKLASRKHTLNIFIISSCRTHLSQETIRSDELKHLNEDAFSDKWLGYPQNGYSVVVYAAEDGKVALDGKLC
jgi:hypothetical protein